MSLKGGGVEGAAGGVGKWVRSRTTSLTEATLNGATVTVSLGGLTFASGVSASSFALVTSPAIAGLSIATVTGGARTVTVTAQDADANRAAGDRDTLTFQVTVFDNPIVAASPTAAARSMIRRKPEPAPRRIRAVTPRDLIQTARRLTESGAAQPTQADLRCAVSTAYYALFHCLAGAAADLLTGSGSHSPEWHQVYRALEHGKAKRACRQQEAMRAFPTQIHSFAKAFADLQGARHEADYTLEGQYLKRTFLR